MAFQFSRHKDPSGHDNIQACKSLYMLNIPTESSSWGMQICYAFLSGFLCGLICEKLRFLQVKIKFFTEDEGASTSECTLFGP